MSKTEYITLEPFSSDELTVIEEIKQRLESIGIRDDKESSLGIFNAILTIFEEISRKTAKCIGKNLVTLSIEIDGSTIKLRTITDAKTGLGRVCKKLRGKDPKIKTLMLTQEGYRIITSTEPEKYPPIGRHKPAPYRQASHYNIYSSLKSFHEHLTAAAQRIARTTKSQTRP